MKKTILWILKASMAGLVSFAVISGICFFYYNLPVHYTNTTGATDYFWDKETVSMRGTEGFAYTKTDENGFVNTFPEKKDEINVLVMGSSHAEGFNVDSDENFTYVLNKKFKDNGQDKYVYNIGTSSHNFVRCLKNLEDAIETYKPTEYVVIETSAIDFDVESLEQLNSGIYETLESRNTGLIYQLQKLDFVRLVYAQISNFTKKDSAATDEQKTETETDLTQYKQLVEEAVQNASKIAEENNCKIVILYCPKVEVDYYGKIVEKDITPEQDIFKSACEKYAVECIDMFSSYEAMYKETNNLPQGFSNTAVGAGHTNKYGHNCIAEELYKFIVEE